MNRRDFLIGARNAVLAATYLKVFGYVPEAPMLPPGPSEIIMAGPNRMMTSPVNIAALNKVFKEIYADKMKELIPNGTSLLLNVKKKGH